MKKLFSLILCLMMLCGCAQAAGDPLSDAYLDLNSDVHFAISAQIDELVPYGDGAVEQFNQVLKHLSVNASLMGEDTGLEICVAGDPVIALAETAKENGFALTTPLLPNRVLTSKGSAMDALIGTEEAAFDFFAAVTEAGEAYPALAEAIVPYSEEKQSSYTIKNIATSKRSRVAKLTAEQAAELAPLIQDVLVCGMNAEKEAFIRSLAFGKGFTVALYQLDKGTDMAVYMKGDVLLPDGSRRALSYQWAWADKDGQKRYDTFKLEITKAKAPKDDFKANGFYKRSTKDTALLIDGDCSVVEIANGVTTTTTTAHDLSGKENGSVRTVKGSFSTAVKTAQKDKSTTITTTVEPDVKLTSSEGSGVLSGTAHVEQTKGKLVLLSASLTFDEEPAEVFMEAAETGTLFIVIEDSMPESSLTLIMDDPEEPAEPEKASDFLVGKPPIGYVAHTAPKEETVVDLDAVSEEALASLMDELSQNLAGKLLIAVSKLPEDATSLLRDLLSEENYAAFEALVEAL